MKKVIPTTWLKAIITLCFLLISLFTSNAQQGKWEIGVGLRPLNLEDDPFNLVLKRYATPHFALRLGLGLGYREKSRFEEYLYPYGGDTSYHFTYEYTRIDKKFHASSFLGIQYSISKHDVNKRNFFDWYLLSDLTIKYSMQKAELPNGVLYVNSLLQEGDNFFIVELDNKKELAWGIRQGLGVKYTLNRNMTIGIEAGAYYEWIKTSANKTDLHVLRKWGDENVSYSGTNYNLRETRNYSWGFSPVTFLSFNYHF